MFVSLCFCTFPNQKPAFTGGLQCAHPYTNYLTRFISFSPHNDPTDKQQLVPIALTKKLTLESSSDFENGPTIKWKSGDSNSTACCQRIRSHLQDHPASQKDKANIYAVLTTCKWDATFFTFRMSSNPSYDLGDRYSH